MANKRNTNLNYALFKVEQHPIFIKYSQPPAAPLLFDETDENPFYSQIDRFQAVVDVERDYVFSVVAGGYRLITNEEAVRLGKECFKSVFSRTTADGMEVFNITMPKTRSFCHIDFVHQDSTFKPWEQDEWSPFLRVTNSYNRTKLLRFDLGFCRWICSNGMIFGNKSITFRYTHTHGAVEKLEFKTSFGELKKLEAEFIEKLHNLKRFHVPQNQMLPMVCKAFEIKFGKEDLSKPRRTEQLSEFKNHVNELTAKYYKELDSTAYAALNIITDFATRPKSFISQESMVDILQKRSGAWMDDFINQINDKKFTFDQYLSDYKETVKILESLN
jgi:hypothetical protein